MAYTKTAWVNGGTPAINATNLNKIEQKLFDLDAYTETPTNLATATVTQEITSLASTAIKSKLNAVVSGNTEVNILNNGNFASTSEWSAVNGTATATSNKISITGNGGGATASISQTTKIPSQSNRKIYVRARARVTNANCTAIKVRITDGTNETVASISTPIQNQWYLLSSVLSLATVNGNNYQVVFDHEYADAATQNAKVMEIKEAMALELTNRFLAGNEPDTATADKIYANYFDGIKYVDKVRVKATGKNICPNDVRYWEQGSLDANGENSTSTNAIRQTSYLRVEPNTSYVISTKSGFRIVVLAEYETNFNKVNRTAPSSNSYVFTTTNSTRYIRLSVGDDPSSFTIPADIVNMELQIEKGSTKTTYEQYTETTAFIPVELRGARNIKDTYDISTGRYTKNLSDWVNITGNGFTWSIHTDLTGSKRFSTIFSALPNNVQGLPHIMLKYNNLHLMPFSSGAIADVSSLGSSSIDKLFYVWVSDTDTGFEEAWTTGTTFTGMTFANLIKAYFNGWKLTTANTNVASCVWTGIASGTTQSGSTGYNHVIANIDTGFTPYRIMYQLNTPIIQDFFPNIVNAEPSGSIFVKPFVQDINVYGTNIPVIGSSYPIKMLDYVNLVDAATGKLTPINLSLCTIANDELSFTISGASAGQYYDFGYIHKDLSVVAELSYSYATNLKAQVNNNTDQIGLLDKKIEQVETYTEANLEQINTKLERYGASAVGTDSYAVTNTYQTKAYYTGMVQTFKADVSNTGTASLNVDGLGAKNIKKITPDGKSDLGTGDIIANGIYTLVYDGTDFIYIPDGYKIIFANASDDILLSADTERTHVGGSWSGIIKKFKVKYPGTYRLTFESKITGGQGAFKIVTSYGQIEDTSLNSPGTIYNQQSLDVTVRYANSTIDIYMMGYPGETIYIKNVKIKGTYYESPSASVVTD